MKVFVILEGVRGCEGALVFKSTFYSSFKKAEEALMEFLNLDKLIKGAGYYYYGNLNYEIIDLVSSDENKDG